jgi:hypothetical protein
MSRISMACFLWAAPGSNSLGEGSYCSGSGGGQVGPSYQEIDISAIADGIFIDSRDPPGDGIAAGQRMVTWPRLEANTMSLSYVP